MTMMGLAMTMTMDRHVEDADDHDLDWTFHNWNHRDINMVMVRHEVMWRMLEQFPHSRLGKLAKVGGLCMY